MRSPLVVAFIFGSIAASPVAAQIVPDTSLPQNAIVVPNGNTFVIDGGTTAGTNLFHSFSEFSVPTGTEAFFNNATSIDNIITRVTGGNISNIDGLIRANGSANLFLLNPNGIVFGENAQLAIGGSFLGSTAESLQFADGFEFSSLAPEANPILTVSVPVGLQMGSNSGAIASEANLTLSPGQTLSFIGGEISLNGGVLQAPGGRVELVATAAQTYPIHEDPISLVDPGNILLSGGASVDVSGEGGGSIVAGGDRLDMVEGSTLRANTLGAGDGGNIDIQVRQLTLNDGSFIEATVEETGVGTAINIRATDSVTITGMGYADLQQRFVVAALSGTFQPGDRTAGLFASVSGAGTAGDITVETGNLRLENGAYISAPTFGSGPGGNVTLRADEVRIEGSAVTTTVAMGVTGTGGRLDVEGRSLVARNGGFLSTTTLGSGNGGDLRVRTSETVDLQGTSLDSIVPTGSIVATGLFANSIVGTGASGDISLETDRVILGDGGEIFTGSGAERSQAQIPLGGTGGAIDIVARESIEIFGQSPDGTFSSGVGTETFSSADAGNLTIVTPQLVLRQGGLLSVDSNNMENGGKAGDLSVNAPTTIYLEAEGTIEAQTLSGDGGNIRLQTSDLQLRRASRITTNAGGNGGNINIDTDTLVALENSDITANAEVGFGGRVSITSTGIFGTQFREFLTPQSDITATSDRGAEFSGVVEINTPDIDSTSGLFNLQTETIDASAIAFDSCRDYEGSEFYYTGNGGIPENPRQFLEIQMTVDDLGEIVPVGVNGVDPSSVEERRGRMPFAPTETLTEATSWTIAPNGKIALVSQVTTAATLPQPECD